MKISYNWLKDYISKLPKPEKLVDLLTTYSFEVKTLKKSGNDYVLDIDVLPNRAHDCLSHIGVARECSALLSSKFKYQSPKPAGDKKTKIEKFIKVEVKDRMACPRYTARIVTNIKVGQSPNWLKQRLEAIGQKSINNIVDATNYVMFEIGQPLHAFDYEKISRPQSRSGSGQGSGAKIIVRRAKKGEKMTTLDNEVCKLDESILVIADKEYPLALAGVKGGNKAEITNKTKTIVLESANFSIPTIRATFRKTGLKTESSLRFEYGLDSNLTRQAIDRVAELIQEIAGGEIVKGVIDIYPKKVFPQKIKMNLQKIESILGIKISKSEVIKYLRALGFEIDNSLKVTVPTFRQDIKIEEDLIEEIARLVGYDSIPAKAPLGLLGITKLDETLITINKIKSNFESLGYTEVYNFSFVGEEDLKRLGIKRENYVELENPLSLDLKYLRRNLLINLLKNVKDNAKAVFGRNEEIKIFELGKVYQWRADRIKEERILAGIVANRNEKMEKDIFYRLKGAIDSLLNKLGITDQWYDDFKATPKWTDEIFWQKSGAAEVKVGDEEIGFLGEINSEILNKLNIRGAVVAFNLNFEMILRLAREEVIYQPPSLYPAAVRDLAVLVNLGDRVVDVLNVIDQVGGDLVRDVDLFDMYEGEEIPDGKKSLAFHIIYQSAEKTLTDEEVDKIQKKIIRALEKRWGWGVRK
jgi:phenylalanyl-tRNA synthetase beta chain